MLPGNERATLGDYDFSSVAFEELLEDLYKMLLSYDNCVQAM